MLCYHRVQKDNRANTVYPFDPGSTDIYLSATTNNVAFSIRLFVEKFLTYPIALFLYVVVQQMWEYAGFAYHMLDEIPQRYWQQLQATHDPRHVFGKYYAI